MDDTINPPALKGVFHGPNGERFDSFMEAYEARIKPAKSKTPHVYVEYRHGQAMVGIYGDTVTFLTPEDSRAYAAELSFKLGKATGIILKAKADGVDFEPGEVRLS